MNGGNGKHETGGTRLVTGTTSTLAEVPGRLRKRWAEHAKFLGESPDEKKKEEWTAKDFQNEETIYAAEEILLACRGMKRAATDAQLGRSDGIEPQSVELFASAVQGFCQAIKGQRRAGALQLMREAIGNLDKMQRRALGPPSEPPPAP